jgi:hypothetical protein
MLGKLFHLLVGLLVAAIMVALHLSIYVMPLVLYR